MLVPVLYAFSVSLNAENSLLGSDFSFLPNHMTLQNYKAVFTEKPVLLWLKNSLILAVSSCGVSAVIGTLGAVGLSRIHWKTKGVMEYISILPLMIPEIILGMVFLSVFSLMGLPFGMVTLVIAHTTFCVPYVFTMVRARLVGMDRSLEEAALDLGATKWQVFRDVILPQILPAILSGVLLAFAMSFDDVVISIFVTGPKVNTLPVKIYTKLKTGVTPEINALATVMLFVILLCLAGAYVLGRKSQTAVEKAAGGK